MVHPFYLFGNPLSIKHPPSRAKCSFEPSSRALFEDMVPLGDDADTEGDDGEEEEEEGVRTEANEGFDLSTQILRLALLLPVVGFGLCVP